MVVPVYVSGPRGGAAFRFAVDTAATRTSMSGLVLGSLGFRPDQVVGNNVVRTGSGTTRAGFVRAARFAAFGRVLADFPVYWLPLPPATRIDGLLGLGFLRGHVLTIDFVRHTVALRPPRPWWAWWAGR